MGQGGKREEDLLAEEVGQKARRATLMHLGSRSQF